MGKLHGLVTLVLCSTVCADVYMHAPRGSNDRNCEKNVNRNNGNRLFDSQNNAKGGYACPRPRVGPNSIVDKMYLHPGSKSVIEWTNQHGCGSNPKTHCEIVIQYACEDTLDPEQKWRSGDNTGSPRDGTPRDNNDDATNTIPDDEESSVANTVETRRFGMHESFDFYKKCKQRSSNKGLYTSDQRLNRGRGARATRQNPNGNRRGLECPEERDYYPYWAPSPWRDIAVITANPERCPYYKKASQNKVARGECMEAETFFPKNHIYESKCRIGGKRDNKVSIDRKNSGEWYNSKEECEAVGHKWIPTWYDLKHPSSQKALVNMKNMKVSDVGRMNYEVFKWDAAAGTDKTCNTLANVALEKLPKVNTLKMTAEDWSTLEGTAVTFKDGQIHIVGDARSQDGKHVVYSKQKFKGPLKVEVVYRQATTVNECVRLLVFPDGQEDPAANWARGLSSKRVQIGAGGWGRDDPFYMAAEGGIVGKQDVIVKKGSDRHGCQVKISGCPNRGSIASKFADFAPDGTATEALCTTDDARKNYWNKACNIADAEVKWVALPIAAREDQTMVLEVWPNQTATYTLNGQFIDNFLFNKDGAGNKEGVIALTSCTEYNIKSVKITQSGMYGMSTAKCADNLRNAVVGEARLAHTFGSSFAGEATDCGGSEALTPCTTPLCRNSKFGSVTPRVQRLSGYIIPAKDAEYEFSAWGAYGMELWLDNNKLISSANATGQKTTGGRVSLKKGTGYRFQAFSLAVTSEDVGCFVMVPTECTKQVDNFKRSWGKIGEWNRDYHGEARGSAFSQEACLKRKRDFDGFCGITDSEMKFKAPDKFGGEFKIDLKVGTKPAQDQPFEGTTYSPLTTKSGDFTICTTKDCKEPKKVCQTKATDTCTCDTWADRAPEKWWLTKDAGSCCMRPTYDVKAGPWCYCKGGGKDNIPDFAQCLPELAPNKGKLDLAEAESEDSWAEADGVSMVEVEEAAEAPTTGVTGTTDESPVIADVDCLDGKHASSRENQLGNAIDTANPDDAIPHNQNANRYIWTVPDHVNDNCVIRLRYNISTSDYPDWANDGTPLTTSSSNANLQNNKYVGPDGRDTTSPVMQDPYVGIGDDPQETFLSLAVNTNQYGRTFQDRSYVFAIKPIPDGVEKKRPDGSEAKIYNVNVRGKRGNIVQTYPAVEYDFVPNDLCTEVGDYVHFQWTGSDYNPQRNPNDAEGGGDSDDQNQARRADRTNLVELDLNGNSIKFPTSETRVNNEGPFPESKNQTGAGKRNGEVALGMNYPAGALGDWANLKTEYKGMFWKNDQATEPDKDVIMNLAFIDQVKRMQNIGKRCLTLEELNAKKQDERERNPGNCAKLNGAKAPYFDGGLVKMRKAGKFSYYSSRNNNFSNRNQAGCICVGQTTCKKDKGCQVNIEDEHRKKMKSEIASTGKKVAEEVAEPKLLEVAEPKQALCDADCVAALRAQVSALNEQVSTLKSGL